MSEDTSPTEEEILLAVQEAEAIPDEEIEDEEESPSKVIDKIPEPEDIKSEDVPNPHKDEVPDEVLLANEKYWSTKNLALAGRLQESFEFLPGRSVELHTLDQAETIFVGKQVDTEFGRLDPRVGVSSAYDDGHRLITLSIAAIRLDGEEVYTPTSDLEDPMNADLSYHNRQLALAKKSAIVRRKWSTFNPQVIAIMFMKYQELVQMKREAISILPFYSLTGEKLDISNP